MSSWVDPAADRDTFATMKTALRSAALAALALTALTGCALPFGTQEFRVSATPLAEDAPVDAPVEYVQTRLRRGDSVVYNSLGGEIPRAAPVEPVEERDLGEVTTPNAG